MKKFNYQANYLQLIHNVFENAADEVNNKVSNDNHEKKGSYPCIHLNIPAFISQLTEVIKKQKLHPHTLKFLDVGCGVGQKVFLAKEMFDFNAFGFDLRLSFVQKARELIKMLNDRYYSDWRREAQDKELKSTIFQANALKFNNYSNYDVIYFYCPMHNPEFEIKLEKRIAEQAKIGAIVIGNLSFYFNSEKVKELGWRRLSHTTFIRKSLKA